jgi:crotonobetainyl-CoA:carnitine CoA-transferase CaiB-like acyl-CoA transferase
LKSTIEYPGGFAKFSEGACQIWRRAPLIGEHNQEIYGQELRITPAEIAEL